MTLFDNRGVNKKTARVAGLLYLIVTVTGFFSIVYVPLQTIVPGDAAATVGKIVASRSLFQLGILAALVCYFWGLWLLPFGYLVFKSGFLPRVLGIFLMAGCFGYLINAAGAALSPGYAGTVMASIVSLPSPSERSAPACGC